jgi:phage terminase large subunit GpA-like protein
VTPSEARRGAYIECPNCGGIIEEQQKAEMNSRGRYVAPGQIVDTAGNVTGEPKETSTISFWVSGLASPFVTFGQRAEDFLKAVRLADFERIRTATNASFGELYNFGGGDAPAWAEVAAHKIAYARGEMPTGVGVLICSVDVQKNSLIYIVRGFGARATSWLIDYGVLHGETTSPPVWEDLIDLISTPIAGRHIRLVLVDSGFRPGKPIELPENRIYEFARRFQRNVRCCKGGSSMMRTPLIRSTIEVTTAGRAAKTGLIQLRLDTDHFKSSVFERIKWPLDAPGAWYLPHDTTDDYCRQVASEARIRLPSGRVQWRQTSRENHYLDCESMAAAGAYLLNMARRTTDRGTAAPTPQPVDPVTDVMVESPAPPLALPTAPVQQPGGVPWVPHNKPPPGGWVNRPQRTNPWDP